LDTCPDETLQNFFIIARFQQIREMPSWFAALKTLLRTIGKKLARSPNQVFLDGIAGEELESMPQTIAVADEGAQTQESSASRQSQFKRCYLARLKLSGQCHANPVPAQLNRPPPQFNRSSGAKDLRGNPHIDCVTWIAAALVWIGELCAHFGRHLYLQGLTANRQG
jgi:hypothetical protein